MTETVDERKVEVWLRPDLYERLKASAKHHQEPMAAWMRRAIQRELKRLEKHL